MGWCNSLFQNQCLSSKENVISTALVFNFQNWFTQSKQSMIFAIEQVSTVGAFMHIKVKGDPPCHIRVEVFMWQVPGGNLPHKAP